MFDQIVVKPRGRRWQSVLIVVSAVAHGGLLAGLIVSAMWKIEKLPLINDRAIDLSSPRMQASASPPPAASHLQVQHQEKVVHIVKEVVQPVPVDKDKKVVVPDTGTGTNATGNGTGTDPNAKGTGDGHCVGVLCDDSGDKDKDKAHDECKDPNPPERCKPLTPPIVPPTVAKGLRTSGEDQIYPPDTVKQSMQRDGKTDLRAVVQVCVSAGGRVDSTRLMKSTGYQAYDDELQSKIRDWGYRPYMVGGKASPMCSVVMFTYHVRPN